jgi:outer membrane receptor protein involved in Fe transport
LHTIELQIRNVCGKPILWQSEIFLIDRSFRVYEGYSPEGSANRTGKREPERPTFPEPPDCGDGYKEITERLQLSQKKFVLLVPVNFYHGRVAVSAGINNLFDEDFYAEIRDEGIVPAYRRNYYGGVSFKF